MTFEKLLCTPCIIVAVVMLLMAFCIQGYCRGSEKAVRSRLRSYLDTIKVVDTHEHQRIPPEFEGHKYNFYTILAYSYLKSDLASAGTDDILLQPKIVNDGNLDELWQRYGQYLDVARNTSSYAHFARGFRELYGMDSPHFTKKNIAKLSEKVARNYSDYEKWFADTFKSAGFEIMFVDPYWDWSIVNIDRRYFGLVLHINEMVTSIYRHPVENPAADPQNLFVHAESEGVSIKSLDDYLSYTDSIIRKFHDNNAVCMKNSLAYQRTLDFEPVTYEKAKELFCLPTAALSASQKKMLEDFVFGWIVEKSISYKLPIQIHTGTMAGVPIAIENAMPTKLNGLFIRYPNARFILLHDGYPWTAECTALAKLFPNVYIDIAWLSQLSQTAAAYCLNEMLDSVPYNKIFWGSDTHFIEQAVGTLECDKDMVTAVLAERVEKKLMTEDVARDVLLKIFRDNAVRVFDLAAKQSKGNIK